MPIHNWQRVDAGIFHHFHQNWVPEILPDEKRLILASYAASDFPEAFVQPISFGEALPDMPLFLSSGIYVPVPLEMAYQSAWEAMPAFWRDFLNEPAA